MATRKKKASPAVKITIDGEVHVSPEEASSQLGISTATLWRWRRVGKLRTVKMHGRALIPVSEIERNRTD